MFFFACLRVLCFFIFFFRSLSCVREVFQTHFGVAFLIYLFPFTGVSNTAT